MYIDAARCSVYKQKQAQNNNHTLVSLCHDRNTNNKQTLWFWGWTPGVVS